MGGLDHPLARLVAERLMLSDALGAHARDELGITETLRARPIQAAIASAISFVAGAIVPISATFLAPSGRIAEVTTVTAIGTLVVLGGTAAYTGGASIFRGALRVAFWGALSMLLTAGVGKLVGVVL